MPSPVICLPRGRQVPAWGVRLQALPQCWQPGIYQCPTDDPIWQSCEARTGGDIPEASEEVKRDGTIILRHKELWVLLTPLISDYYLFFMDYQHTLKHLAFPETICCQILSFEECFPYVIKPPYPISSCIETGATEGKDKEKDKMKKREKRNRWRKEIKFLRKKEPTKPGKDDRQISRDQSLSLPCVQNRAIVKETRWLFS